MRIGDRNLEVRPLLPPAHLTRSASVSIFPRALVCMIRDRFAPPICLCQAPADEYIEIPDAYGRIFAGTGVRRRRRLAGYFSRLRISVLK